MYLGIELQLYVVQNMWYLEVLYLVIVVLVLMYAANIIVANMISLIPN